MPAYSASRSTIVVGIGASAGGLEAFELFFRHCAADSGMAFVLVQHLDPNHVSLLGEILQRCTQMPVIQASDRLAILPNHVYLIPPNRDLELHAGKLRLRKPTAAHGVRKPIDHFFCSLAQDMQQAAIGILLSGTGNDGTEGLEAILAAGGTTLVQVPGEARYDGMPNSAIKAGCATHVLPVAEMPLCLQQRPLAPPPSCVLQPETLSPAHIQTILQLLQQATGHNFSQYKKSTINRRIQRHMELHEQTDAARYIQLLQQQPQETHALFQALLINVTSFFRDPDAFDVLRQEILPLLCEQKQPGELLRIWVAGCASGEEAYSIAMLLREFMDETGKALQIQLFATDLDDEAIAQARAGVFAADAVAGLSEERLRRFFVRQENSYRIRREIREMVVFAVQNIIKDPPFTRLDLLCCRNLMIYLEPALQNRLIPMFHYALRPGGMLFLSPSESTGNHHHLFTPQHRKWKFYRANPCEGVNRAAASRDISFPAHGQSRAADEIMKKPRDINYAELTRRALLQSYAPASVLTDQDGTILYIHGDTGKFLSPAPGEATLNVAEMAREGLQMVLRQAIFNAASERKPTLDQELAISNDGALRRILFSLRLLSAPETAENLLLISFQEALATPGRKKRGQNTASADAVAQIAALERDLAYTRETLQATIEEQQLSNDELTSTNEELQSTNEELQSSNEELETSKEELQSVNEELVTVNAELQAKIEQLVNMQNDMKNLLDNLSVGTIFLDQQLLIRRFTREATRVYRLIASDVGRPLSDIKSELQQENLLAQAQAVLDSETPFECELQTEAGVWFLVRIQPYRTVDNLIEGVALTFTDISKRVEAEAAVQEARDLAEGIVNTVQESLLVLDGSLRVVAASRAFYRDFQVRAEDTLGRPIYQLGDRQWDIPELRELLETIIPRDQHFDGYTVEHNFPGIGTRRMLLNARRIAGKNNHPPLVLLALQHADKQAGDHEKA